MSVKQLYFQDTSEPVENIARGKTRSLKPLTTSIVINGNNTSESHFLLRLQEMELRNAKLEKLVEQKTKELTEAAETHTKFISIIAHDLRSPFSSILGVLEILKESLSDYNTNEIAYYINIASNSANRTLTLLESLLAWAISQNREKTFSPVKIKLHELLTTEIEDFKTSATQKQITLNHSIAPTLSVCADIQMVKTILRNLISNAIKYTNSGGEINISASRNKSFVEIDVVDTGIGISPEAQRNLFKIDALHSTAGTNNEKGIGLGLLLCKEFVEMHGGSIQIMSKEGSGSRFKFTLPNYILSDTPNSVSGNV